MKSIIQHPFPIDYVNKVEEDRHSNTANLHYIKSSVVKQTEPGYYAKTVALSILLWGDKPQSRKKLIEKLRESQSNYFLMKYGIVVSASCLNVSKSKFPFCLIPLW